MSRQERYFPRMNLDLIEDLGWAQGLSSLPRQKLALYGGSPLIADQELARAFGLVIETAFEKLGEPEDYLALMGGTVEEIDSDLHYFAEIAASWKMGNTVLGDRFLNSLCEGGAKDLLR